MFRTDLGQWLILVFVCRLYKWIGRIISPQLQNLSYPKGKHTNTIGGQVFEFSEFFIQNLHYVQDWPWTMINFGVCLSTLQMNWENLTTLMFSLMFIFSLCPRYIHTLQFILQILVWSYKDHIKYFRTGISWLDS